MKCLVIKYYHKLRCYFGRHDPFELMKMDGRSSILYKCIHCGVLYVTNYNVQAGVSLVLNDDILKHYAMQWQLPIHYWRGRDVANCVAAIEWYNNKVTELTTILNREGYYI